MKKTAKPQKVESKSNLLQQPQELDLEQLLSAKEAARLLKISPSTLSRIKKRIGFYRIGVKTLFDPRNLAEYRQKVFVAPQEK